MHVMLKFIATFMSVKDIFPDKATEGRFYLLPLNVQVKDVIGLEN